MGINVLAFQNPKQYCSVEDAELAMCRIAGAVKKIMSTAYGMAYFTMLDAIDAAKKSSTYKRNYNARRYFGYAIKAFEDNRRNLLYADTNRFFHVGDMPDDLRSMYKEGLTDREYFDCWIDMGASSHKCYNKELTVLRYKCEKFLKPLYDEADIMSWMVISQIAFEEAVRIYKDGVLLNLGVEYGFTTSIMDEIYHSFSLEKVLLVYEKAAKALYPELDEIAEKLVQDRNIQLGLEQFEQALGEALLSTDAAMEAVEDNAELWADNNSLKKAKRIIRTTDKNIRLAKQNGK